MKGFSGSETLLLCVTILFAALCAVSLCPDRESDGLTVRVSKQLQESSPLTTQVQEDSVPDSLIPGEKINVNTAPPLDLARLPGIGESRAGAIAAWREENGVFRTPEDLLAVKGIGEKTLEAIREYIIFD